MCSIVLNCHQIVTTCVHNKEKDQNKCNFPCPHIPEDNAMHMGDIDKHDMFYQQCGAFFRRKKML